MKQVYYRPVISCETVELSQIIAASPSTDATPKIDDTPSSGGEGLVDDRENWGELW